MPEVAQAGVIAIAAGASHSVAVKEDGSVVAWGNNEYGQTTVPPEADSGVIAVAAGTYHTLALKIDGTVVAWGTSDFGHENTVGNFGQTNIPTGLKRVTAIAAGGFHSVVLIGTGLDLPASLGVQRHENELILSWPSDAIGFVLQAAPSLTSPVAWSDVEATPAIVEARFTVSLPFSANTRFYRLKR